MLCCRAGPLKRLDTRLRTASAAGSRSVSECTARRMLIQFNEFSLDELQRQNLVYLTRIIPTAIKMAFKHLLHRSRTKIRSAAAYRIK